MNRRCSYLFVVLAALVATGCFPRHIPPVSPSSTYGQSIHRTAAATALDGQTHYFAWDECPTGSEPACRIAFTWSLVGEANPILYLTPPVDQSYNHPDLAAGEDGLVYIVWASDDYSGSTNKRWGCYAIYDPADPQPLECEALPDDSVIDITDYPRVAASPDGYYVYALFKTWLGRKLYARRIGPAMNYDHYPINVHNAEYIHHAFDMIVDSQGYLHVAYIAYHPEPEPWERQVRLGFSRTSTGPEYLQDFLFLNFSPAELTPAVTYIQPDNIYSFVAAVDEDFHPVIFRAGTNATPGSPVEIPGGYFTTWPMDIINLSQEPWVVFVARPAEGPVVDYELYKAHFDQDTVFQGGGQITADSVDDITPAVVSTGGMVIAWRKANGDFAGDVWVYDEINGTRMVFNNLYSGVNPPEISLTSSWQMVAGMWVDRASSSGRDVPWFSLNVPFQGYLPVVNK